MLKTILSSLLLCSSIHAFEFRDSFEKTRLDVGNATGNFIGIQRSYLEFGLFTPLSEGCEWTPFFDARGYYFQNDRWGANAGFGLRYLLDNNYILGANTYYDYLEGDRYANFHRVGAGLELLTDCFDIRINGYFPLQTSNTRSWPLYSIANTGVYWNLKEFAVRTGFDAEIGTHLFYWGNFSIYGATGPYYYDFGNHNLKHGSFWGIQARVEADWNDYLLLELRTSYDRLYRSEAQFKLQFSMPIEDLIYAFDNCPIEAILQPVKRNGIIFKNSLGYYNTR